MKTSSRLIATRIGLATALALSVAGAALAQEVLPETAMQIAPGTNQDAVHSQLGEPIKVASYLFAPGKSWFYYVKGSIPGNEKLVEIQFDDQGLAQSSKLIDAKLYGLNRWD